MNNSFLSASRRDTRDKEEVCTADETLTLFRRGDCQRRIQSLGLAKIPHKQDDRPFQYSIGRQLLVKEYYQDEVRHDLLLSYQIEAN